MMTATPIEYKLGRLAEIPLGEGREFAVDGQLIAVFNVRGGGLYATQALCPHRDGPLIDGLIGGTTVVCPFHAWKFNMATGEALMGNCGLTTYPVRLNDNGVIVLTLTSELPHPHPGEPHDASGANVFSRDEIEGKPMPASGST